MLFQFYRAAGTVQHALAPAPDHITWLEKQALKELGAEAYRIADIRQDPVLLNQVTQLYIAAGYPQEQPKVLIYKQDNPNACFIHNGTIAISSGLLNMMDRDEREAVLAHEITHKKQRWWNLGAVLVGIAAVFETTNLATGKYISHLKGKWQNPEEYPLVAANLKHFSAGLTAIVFSITSGVVGFLAKFPLRAFSRHQEMDADRGGAELSGKPRALIGALNKLSNYWEEKKAKEAQPVDIPYQHQFPEGLIAPVGFSRKADEKTQSGIKERITKIINDGLRDHPSHATRIRQLEAIAQAQERRR